MENIRKNNSRGDNIDKYQKVLIFYRLAIKSKMGDNGDYLNILAWRLNLITKE